ncbi:chemotaxis protein MotC [Agrobacterium sp.]|jgi:chemotaxis protein MotC|uniref:chemotaxis protein MotC n=1 Tax=Agrobacterium sp. TaxID=361 RepID=UPI003917D9AF
MMRMRLPKRWVSLLAAVSTFVGAAESFAQSPDNLMPYSMLRSLQFVQDSVVLGDHSAAEMQRFMLTTIDERLRDAPPSIFADPRNVDAALIYAMSGGNPATLELLVAKDVDGNFDTRVADALRKYLSGRGTLIAKGLGAMVPEYRKTRIGPYLALISGNVTLAQDPVAALKFYDIARLEAPGTIVEEAALRRSLAIAVEDGDATQGFKYAQRYARRFLHSPYASQFADLIVALSVRRYEHIDEATITDTVALMDADRQRETYLRMARMATVAGKEKLARMAATKAKDLSTGLPVVDGAPANLYESLANIGTPDIVSAIKTITSIPDEHLSDRDKILRDAAKAIAEEVVRPPVASAASLQPGTTGWEGEATLPVAAAPGSEPQVTEGTGVWRNPTPVMEDLSPEYKSTVSSGRSKLDEIDALLKKEGSLQ